VLSAIAIAIAVPGYGAGDHETSPSEQARTTASTSSASRLPDVASTVPASSTAGPSPAPSVDLGAPSWSAVYGFGGAWVQVDPPVDQIVKVDEASGAVALTVDAGTGAAVGQDAGGSPSAAPRPARSIP
jgi:hypothetical protein